MNNRDKRFFSGPVIGLSVVLVLAVVMLIGSSYAYYQVTSSTSDKITLKSGALEVTLDDMDSEEITLENGQPVTDQEGMSYNAYTFTLENTGNIDGDFVLYLDDVALEDGIRMNDRYVKYNLVKDNDYDNIKLLSVNTSFRTESGITSRMIGKGTIKAGEKYQYRLNLWISDTADNGVMGTTFRARLRIAASQVVQKICEVTSGNGDDIGDEITCGDEIFNVIASDESSVTMLSRYFIDPVDIGQKKEATLMSFADTPYWENDIVTYPAYVYNSGSNIYDYLIEYNTHLKNLGMTSASSSLMSLTQLEDLGCDLASGSCLMADNFIYNSSYWLGNASDNLGNVYYVSSDGSILNGACTEEFGIRPVVTISKSDF